ncbi:hypothetical protein AB0M87_31435 [Streptomyces sp. NPDC051320]|uniref:hypothetical protein n=1 Tax=Streptomyces sp. NPDC051320 TaxID=3154644 RepID=UPI00342CCBA0
MTATPRRRPWALLAGTILLLITGLVLVAPHSDSPPRPMSVARAALPAASFSARASGTPAAAAPAPAAQPSREVRTSPPPTRKTEGIIPDRGDGPAGDPAIQQLLERSWPADLPAADEHQLRLLGSALLRTDATGKGQPGETDRKGAVVPEFTRFRI